MIETAQLDPWFGEMDIRFLDVIRPRELLPPSEWAETAPRMIPDNGINPEPGPMSFDRTPYGREIIDTLVLPDVEMVVFPKCTQVGYTTWLEMLPGYFAAMDPGACLIVGPDEDVTKNILGERVLPTIESTPALREYLTGKPRDTKASLIQLTTMPILVAWARSAAKLAMWPIRYLLLDEVDKFPPNAGREGDPILLAMKRTSNWKHRARTFMGSTPTIREGNIWTWYESCGDRRKFYLPCPHCGEYQALEWAQVKWPKWEGLDKKEQADRIKIGLHAWYECQHCEAKILDLHHEEMLERGKWISQSQKIDKKGTIKGKRPDSKRIGFHLNSLYSPWLTFSDLASEYLLAIGSRDKMQDFRNSRLALPFEAQVSRPTRTIFEQKIDHAREAGWKPALVPEWAGLLTMTVDTQKDHFWANVRAWGHGFKSRLIYYARLETFEDIEELMSQRFPIDHDDNELMPIRLTLIDSGGTKSEEDKSASRTDQVYRFANKHKARVRALKGASHAQSMPIRASRLRPTTKRKYAVNLWLLDVNWFKDLLNDRINAEAGDEGEFQLTAAADLDDYLMGMSGEHKVFNRRRNTYVWEPVSPGAKRDSWDTEVYQMAAADMARAELIPQADEVKKQRNVKRKAQADAKAAAKEAKPRQRKREGTKMVNKPQRRGFVGRNKGKY
jgi:phage terminase large subunit GpA-like protein